MTNTWHKGSSASIFLTATLVLVIAFCLCSITSYAAAETLITCSSPTTCNIFIFRSGAPQTLTSHTLTLIPPRTNGENNPITGTSVTVDYDGAAATLTCDANWHTAGPFPEIADQYSCTITGGGTAVLFNLKIYDQDVYNYSYDSNPAASVDPYLVGTSEASPFCARDNTVTDAEACKWEQQNLNDPALSARGVPLNDWVVYARTDISNLKLTFEVTQDNSPFVDGDVICAADLDSNGDVDQTEIDYCLTTDIAGSFLCPYALTDCVFETKPPICPSGSSFNPTNNKCETPWYCPPGGYTLSGDLCYSYTQIACLIGGSYWASLHQCVAGAECPPGYGFSSSDCACVSSSFWCSAGIYNPSTHLCEATPGAGSSCPSGFAYNGTTDLCEGSPSCAHGSFNPGTEQCVAGASCPSGYGINCSASRCEAVPSCSDGSTFNTDTNRCETPSICPSGFTRTDHNCQADPACPPCDMLFNPSTHLCEGDACPHNHDSACYECLPVGGINKCSPYSCYVYPHFQNTDTQQGTNDKQDDGTVDSNGNCLGTIYIFNGKDMRCREAGVETGWFNCCDGGDTWFGLGKCKGEEEQLSTQKSKELCHYIGDYCSNRWPLVGCVQRKKTYCCFNSKLGRILQEQGRKTLQPFGPTGDWGDPKSPNCRGFTAEEFQMLDFDNIDLSEWYGDIVTRAQENIENSMQDKIQNFYDKTH